MECGDAESFEINCHFVFTGHEYMGKNTLSFTDTWTKEKKTLNEQFTERK